MTNSIGHSFFKFMSDKVFYIVYDQQAFLDQETYCFDSVVQNCIIIISVAVTWNIPRISVAVTRNIPRISKVPKSVRIYEIRSGFRSKPRPESNSPHEISASLVQFVSRGPPVIVLVWLYKISKYICRAILPCLFILIYFHSNMSI